MSTFGVISYRAEVPLCQALPNQFRQGNLATLGDLRRRQGDDDVRSTSSVSSGLQRRAWARLISLGFHLDQSGSASAASSGRLRGLQVSDLWAVLNWRAGLYVGRLEGDVGVNGFVDGQTHQHAGSNRLGSQYVSTYGTFTDDNG